MNVHVAAARLDLSPPPRPDGYKEIAAALQVWGALSMYTGPREHFWLVMVAARRLDTAHRQMERVREAVASLRGTTRGLVLTRQLLLLLPVIGDAELAVIALYRAAASAQRVSDFVTVPFPRLVAQRMDGLKQMRDAFEHSEDRALGYVSRQMMDPEKAWQAMRVFGEELRGTRKIRYRRWSLGIDQPATDLFLALRRFLRKSWLELCR